MSGLFRRLSSRRSAGPEGNEPHTAAEPGATDAPATTPAEPGGHRSLLADPAAETRVHPDASRVIPGGGRTPAAESPSETDPSRGIPGSDSPARPLEADPTGAIPGADSPPAAETP